MSLKNTIFDKFGTFSCVWLHGHFLVIFSSIPSKSLKAVAALHGMQNPCAVGRLNMFVITMNTKGISQRAANGFNRY